MHCGFSANQLHSDILTAVNALRAMPDDQPKILHVISDFQRSSFVGIDQAAIPQNVQLKLTKTSPEKPSNRGVAVTVTQAGATNLRLYAFNDATPGHLTLAENDSTKTSPITAGHVLTIKPPAARPDGTVSRKLGITEADDLAADNTAIDVFHPQPEIPVWLWQPRQTTDPNRSETEQATYFLARALQPSENPDESISRFRPRAIAEDALADATPPPLLIIPAQESYPEALAKLANDITAQGGSVVFFGGKNLSANSLAPFGKLPPAIPDGIENVPSTPALATINADHPLFGSLSPESRLRLAASPLFERHTLTLSPTARVLAKFADAKP